MKQKLEELQKKINQTVINSAEELEQFIFQFKKGCIVWFTE